MFGQSATDEVKALCYMDSMDQRDDSVKQLVKELLQLTTLDHMLKRIYRLINDQPDIRGILQALETL